jgi:hypothetical protein
MRADDFGYEVAIFPCPVSRKPVDDQILTFDITKALEFLKTQRVTRVASNPHVGNL